ncbi:hypothetical protein ACAX46_004128 [Providencia rettgeri]
MTQTHLTPVNALEKNGAETQVRKKKGTLTQQRRVLIQQQKCAGGIFYQSFLNFMGYTASGVVLWVLMQWQFGVVFSGKDDIPNELLRFKDIWNAAMYIVPYCFWGMSIKNLLILFITLLDMGCTEISLYRLKKKLAH